MRSFLPATILVGAVGCGGTVIAEAPSDGGADSVAAETGIDDTGVVDSFTHDTAPAPSDAPAPAVGATPPPRPSVASTGETKWFLVSKVYLGTINRTTGKADPTAWKAYGYDLDRRTTTADDSKNSVNSCKRVAGSASKVLVDGDLGRDNNFGQHFMAVVKSLKADAEEAMNSQIANGETTMLLRLDNVGADDNASVPGALYRTTTPGGGAPVPPKFTEADHVSIDSAFLDGSKESLIKFPKGFMSKGTWVSGDLGADRVVVSLPGMGVGGSLTLDLPNGTMSFDVKTGSNGIIAGAIGHAAFMKGFTASLSAAGICPGNATFDQIDLTVAGSQDLVLGAPDFQDTTKECSALSIAIGFDVRPSGNWGGINAAPPTDPSLCK
ncbi:MAG: hypothetical protein ACXVEE_32065 [Polyangiales bacterium]